MHCADSDILTNVHVPSEVDFNALLSAGAACGEHTELDEERGMRLGPCASNRKKLSLKDFGLLKEIGKGALGEVRIVRGKHDTVAYAIKTMRKKNMIAKNQATHVQAERNLMAAANNPSLSALSPRVRVHGGLLAGAHAQVMGRAGDRRNQHCGNARSGVRKSLCCNMFAACARVSCIFKFVSLFIFQKKEHGRSRLHQVTQN